ncbi:MAG: low molecular weight protein-tyrosine-phosphatase [Pseudomonadota bacterium]
MSPAKPTHAVLFVCLGNICRSPMAEGAFREAAESAGLSCTVDSAGTAAYHVGNAPDRRAIATARAHGVDIAHLAARQIAIEDFTAFTHIIALDNANLEGIKAHAPRNTTAQISMMMDAVEGRAGEQVKDPYYGDEEGFEVTWADVSVAAQAWVEKLLAESG